MAEERVSGRMGEWEKRKKKQVVSRFFLLTDSPIHLLFKRQPEARI
jgi:hypothetical protein